MNCEDETSLHQQAYRTSFAFRSIVENSEERSSRIRDDIFNITSNQQKANQEDESSEDSYTNASQHDSGSFNGWIWYLFNLMKYELHV